MRRLIQLSALCFVVGLANACAAEEMFISEDIPTAGVRFIHAVPDTGIMDMKAVDIVENSQFFSVAFRNTADAAFYKNARAGERHFRVFMGVPFNPNLTAEQQQAIASTVMADVTLTLEAGHRYTFLMWGYARTGSNPSMRLTVLHDDPADPGSQVAMRVVNATGNPIDVSDYLSTDTPGAVSFANVAPLTASSYLPRPTGTYKFNVRQAGGVNALFADPTALAGTPATIDIDAIPGTTVAGSAISLFVFPGSVAGSQAAQFVNTTTPTSLSATATGYARAAGSFITNGFVPGMQVNATGFTNAANNGLSTITAVTATALTVTKVPATVAEAAGPNRVIVTSPPPAGSITVWDRRPPRAAGL